MRPSFSVAALPPASPAPQGVAAAGADVPPPGGLGAPFVPDAPGRTAGGPRAGIVAGAGRFSFAGPGDRLTALIRRLGGLSEQQPRPFDVRERAAVEPWSGVPVGGPAWQQLAVPELVYTHAHIVPQNRRNTAILRAGIDSMSGGFPSETVTLIRHPYLMSRARRAAQRARLAAGFGPAERVLVPAAGTPREF